MNDWMDGQMSLRGRMDGRMDGNALPNQQQQTDNIGLCAYIRFSKSLICYCYLQYLAFLLQNNM